MRSGCPRAGGVARVSFIGTLRAHRLTIRRIPASTIDPGDPRTAPFLMEAVLQQNNRGGSRFGPQVWFVKERYTLHGCPGPAYSPWICIAQIFVNTPNVLKVALPDPH
jgi:hypothetical protein